MCEPPCHFSPRRIPLSLHQRGDVIEHDDVTTKLVTLPGERGTGAHENPPANLTPKHDLLAPVAITAFQMGARYREKLSQ